MILLTGATGNIGGAALRHLADGPAELRVLLRPGSQPPIFAPNVSYIDGDFNDPASLDRALQDGVQTVFAVSPFQPDMAALKRNLILAAMRTGVGQIVLSSGAYADPHAPSLTHRWLGETEADLRASGLAWTILRPATFMQNYLAQAAQVAAEGVLTAPVGDSTVTLIDTHDVGAAAATVLTDPLRHVGETYELTGTDSLSHSAIARAIGEAMGRPVCFEAIPPEVFGRQAAAAGQPPIMVEAAIEAQRFRLSGRIPPITATVDALLGRPPIRFKAFLREFGDRFHAAGDVMSAGAGLRHLKSADAAPRARAENFFVKGA